MYRSGRGVDDIFDPFEHLYHRCSKQYLDGNRVLPAGIRYANMSVNRQKYSEPEDVIFGYPGFGIIRFIVKMIPAYLKSDGGMTWEFRPAHVPEEDNYAHSEIHAYKDGNRVTKPQPPELIKKKYRQIMSDHAVVLREPTQ